MSRKKQKNFELLDKFINNETRFQALKIINEVHANELFAKLKSDAKERYEFYKSLENK